MQRAISSPFWSIASPFGSYGSTLNIGFAPLVFAATDQPYIVTGLSTIYVSDTADDGSGYYEVLFECSQLAAAITLSGGPTFPGITFITGDGTSDNVIRMQGTIANLNLAMAGLALAGFTTGAQDVTLSFGADTAPDQVSIVIQITVQNADAVISNLLPFVWFDPSDLSTLWQDAARTVPVTTVDDPVYVMDDKSGHGYHAVAGGSSNRPLLKQDGNGKYYLKADGTDDYMVTSSISYGSGDEISILAGVRKADNTSRIIMESSASWVSNQRTFALYHDTDWKSGSRGSATSVIGQVGTSTLSGADLAVLFGTHDLSGDLSTIERNTVAGTSGTSDKGTGTAFDSNVLYLFARAGTGTRFNDRFYGAAIFPGLISGTDKTNIVTWMNTKVMAY